MYLQKRKKSKTWGLNSDCLKLRMPFSVQSLIFKKLDLTIPVLANTGFFFYISDTVRGVWKVTKYSNKGTKLATAGRLLSTMHAWGDPEILSHGRTNVDSGWFSDLWGGRQDRFHMQESADYSKWSKSGSIDQPDDHSNIEQT